MPSSKVRYLRDCLAKMRPFRSATFSKMRLIYGILWYSTVLSKTRGEPTISREEENKGEFVNALSYSFTALLGHTMNIRYRTGTATVAFLGILLARMPEDASTLSFSFPPFF